MDISTPLTQTSTFPKIEMKTNISCDFAPNTRTIREFVTKTSIIHEFALYTSKICKINCDCNAIHVLVFATNAEIN